MTTTTPLGFSEAQWENVALDLLAGPLDWQPKSGDQIVPGSGQRDSWDELKLKVDGLRGGDGPDGVDRDPGCRHQRGDGIEETAGETKRRFVVFEAIRGTHTIAEMLDAGGSICSPTRNCGLVARRTAT